MKITKVIKSAGDYLSIPIDDNDQTLGLTLSGDFSGLLQIVGFVNLNGHEIELKSYNPDGTIADLEDILPLDVFVDVGAYTVVKVIVVLLNSGTISISAVTSSAERIRVNDSGGTPTGQEVQVTNFPSVVNVSGPLTNTQLRASPVHVINDNLAPGAATDASLQTLYHQKLGIDTNGNYLPDNFCSYQSTFTHDGYDNIISQTKVIGANTYTRTFDRDSVGNLNRISGWVKT